MAVPSLVTLGDATQMELILCVALPKVAKASGRCHNHVRFICVFRRKRRQCKWPQYIELITEDQFVKKRPNYNYLCLTQINMIKYKLR